MVFYRPYPYAGALNVRGRRGTILAPAVVADVPLIEDPAPAVYANLYSWDGDGVNDYIDTGVKPADLGVDGTDSRTWSCWVNWDTLANNDAIWSCGAGSSEADWTLRSRQAPSEGQTTANYRMNLWGTDVDFDVTGSEGGWKHIVVVGISTGGMGGTSMWIYVNGSEAATGEGEFVTSNAANIVIGRNVIYGDHYPDAKIDEFSIWNAGMNATQVSELYNSGSVFDITKHSLASSNLKLLYTFNAQDVTDDSGNESAGTNNGGAFSTTVP